MTDSSTPLPANSVPETPQPATIPVTEMPATTVPKSDDYGLVDVPAAGSDTPSQPAGGLNSVPVQPEVTPQKKSKRMLFLLLFLLLLVLLVGGAFVLMSRPTENQNGNTTGTPTPTTGAGDTTPSVTAVATGSVTPSPTLKPGQSVTPTFTTQLGGSYSDADFYLGGKASFKYPTGGVVETKTTGLPAGVDIEVDITIDSAGSSIDRVTYLVGTSAEPIFAGDVVALGTDSLANTAAGFPLETKEFTKLGIADSGPEVIGVYFEFGDRHFAIYPKTGVAEATWMATAKEMIAAFNYAQD